LSHALYSLRHRKTPKVFPVTAVFALEGAWRAAGGILWQEKSEVRTTA